MYLGAGGDRKYLKIEEVVGKKSFRPQTGLSVGR
jgi:hypothetical protein